MSLCDGLNIDLVEKERSRRGSRTDLIRKVITSFHRKLKDQSIFALMGKGHAYTLLRLISLMCVPEKLYKALYPLNRLQKRGAGDGMVACPFSFKMKMENWPVVRVVHGP